MWKLLLPTLLLCGCSSPPVKHVKDQYRRDCYERIMRPSFKCEFYANGRLAYCRAKLPLACRNQRVEEEQT